MIFLVVASPCALAAAMMPTLLSALSNAARHGILFKGSVFVEALGKINVIAFNKTGTLTSGHPIVAAVVSTSGTSPEVLLAHAASVESGSEHPVGRAIVAEAARRRLTLVPASDFQAAVGAGARARLSGTEWLVGRPALFSTVDDVNRSVARLESQGHSVVMVGNGTCLGYIALRDKVRPEAGAAVGFLRHLGIAPIVGLSGDSRATADAVAAEVGVDEMHAGLYPEDKVRKVKELASSHGPVAMVGDEVNDAPALAVAHVGIAMGGIGTDAVDQLSSPPGRGLLRTRIGPRRELRQAPLEIGGGARGGQRHLGGDLPGAQQLEQRALERNHPLGSPAAKLSTWVPTSR